MSNLKICIAQTSPRSGPEVVPESDVFGPLTQNLKTTSELVERAQNEGADLVVFPEYWLQGIVQDREVSRFVSDNEWPELTARRFTVSRPPGALSHRAPAVSRQAARNSRLRDHRRAQRSYTPQGANFFSIRTSPYQCCSGFPQRMDRIYPSSLRLG